MASLRKCFNDNADEVFRWDTLEIAHEIGDKGGQSECYKGLGDVYQNLGRERERIECYAKSIEVTKDIGDEIEKSAHVKRNNRLVDVHQDERTLELCRNFKRINQMMEEYKDSIEKDDDKERFRKAIKTLEVALDMAKKQGYRELEASSYISLNNIS